MLRQGVLKGHSCLWLENDLLRVCVLPDKGADICELLHRASGVQFLMQTPAGLRPPRDLPPADFLENYEGGWQELFPNHNDACDYRGRAIPFHGEVALLPWEWEVLADGPRETALRLSARCRATPFLLRRTMRLAQGEATLRLEEAVRNEGDETAHFVWGHHLVLGGDFLEAGCRLEVPAETIITPDVLFEPATARLAEGQRERWPLARGRRAEPWVDLRAIPGPEEHSHDDVQLTGLERGYLAVANPRLGLTFSLHWDADLFRVVQLWSPFGGADLPPLTGIYGLGIEPWVSRYNLTEAVERGEAVALAAGEALETALRVEIG